MFSVKTLYEFPWFLFLLKVLGFLNKKHKQEKNKIINYLRFVGTVEALKEIATQLGKQDWNFSIDPCSNDTNWATPKSANLPLYNNTVICNCSYPDGYCHVVSMYVNSEPYLCIFFVRFQSI